MKIMMTYWGTSEHKAVDWNLSDPALGLLEVSSIAAGIKAVDEIVKKAPVSLLQVGAVSGGKYLILFSGSEEPVYQSHRHGAELLNDWLIDDFFIPNIHPQVIPVMQGTSQVIQWDAIGVIETASVASAVLGADQAVKNANIDLSEIRLARGIGGKGFFVFTGSLDHVEAGIEAGSHYAGEKGNLIHTTILPNPDREFYTHMS